MNTSTDVMNVNMVEHQRSLLAVLGIDVWMPKVNTPVRNYTASLYRDQAAPETAYVEPIQSFDTVLVPDSAQRSLQEQQAPVSAEVTLVRERVQPHSVEQKVAQVTVDDDARPVIHIDAFELQAWCTERCIIVVDSTDLNAAQSQLWRNIQRAQTGHFFDLKWPFALAPLQDGRGVQVYIQGFLDAMRGDKKIISLGQIKHCQHTDVVVLASLSQMLDQPLLKRDLWALMR